jgi:uncharacterized coiled-coil protein SlyX
MSSLEKVNLITLQHFLERLGSSSKTSRDKIDNNRAVQEVVIEGLQLDLIRTIKVQDVNIEGLQSIMVRIEKVQESNIEGLKSNMIKTTKVEHISIKDL